MKPINNIMNSQLDMLRHKQGVVMENKLKEIIRSSTFQLVPGNYIYAKVSKAPNLNDCFMISKDKDEITAIFEETKKASIKILEKNKDLYRLFGLSVSVPFYAVGLLAAVTNAISDEGINNLVVSTYSKDYVMVRIEHETKTRDVLLRLGFKEIE